MLNFADFGAERFVFFAGFGRDSGVLPPFLKWFSFDLRSVAASLLRSNAHLKSNRTLFSPGKKIVHNIQRKLLKCQDDDKDMIYTKTLFAFTFY